MFWFMFAPGALDDFEQRVMGGLMIRDQEAQALAALSSQFPQLQITNLERQIGAVRDVMIVLTRLINTTLLLLLTGAMMVIIASSWVSSFNRHRQLSLLRVFGLQRWQAYSMSIAEQLIIGLLACVVGILSVQFIAGALFHNLFALSYEPEWFAATGLTLVIAGSFALLGWAFAFRSLRQPIRLSLQ